MPDASKMCPHSHVRRLNAKSWIKPKQKHNAKVKVKCAMRNEQIYGLVTNHSLAHLLEQEWMWALDVEELESSSKIDLKVVSWWMSIKDACRPGAWVTAKLSKEGCISLTARGRPSCATNKHD
jgi:hypothetical protein